RCHQFLGPLVWSADCVLTPSESLVLGTAAGGIRKSDRHPVGLRRCARQLHLVPGVRALREVGNGRREPAVLLVPRGEVRHTEDLVALAPLELSREATE